MEIVKRKILLETSIDRMSGSTYGMLSAITFNIPVYLTQKFDDIGLYTDMEYLPGIPLVNPPNFYEEGFMPKGVTKDMYYGPDMVVTGTTDDNGLLAVRSLSDTTPYIVGLNMSPDIYGSFNGVISENAGLGIVTYVIGGEVNTSGNYVIGSGIIYTTYLENWVSDTDPVTSEVIKTYQKTTYEFISKGRTEFNTTLSALTKEEEYLGVVFPQEVQSDVFIERGGEDIFEKHMVIAEIKTVNDIDGYRGGYLVKSKI